MLRAASNRPAIAYFDAIKNLRLRQVALILKSGLDPNLLLNSRGQNGLQFMINHFGATEAHFRLQAPISQAAYVGIAKLLLDAGLDPNGADLVTGETAMFDAIRLDDRDMVALLLDCVDYSTRNKDGETVLMCAARCGSRQVMRLLLEHLSRLELDGHFLRQRNRLGLTALELARAENLECAKLLTRHLIAHGHQPAGGLGRSLSQRHLAAAPARPPAYLARAGYLGPARYLLPDDSASDYDSDYLAPKPVGLGRPGAAHRRAGQVDPKAAEFSRYLMGQQEYLGEEGARAPAHQSGASDEEEYSAGAGMQRSRSCAMLAGAGAPSKHSGAGHSRYSGAGGAGATSGKKKQQQQQQSVADSLA